MATIPSAVAPPTEFQRRNLVLAAMVLAVAMVVAGVSMLATALAELGADLGASQSSQQWIVDAYALTLAALLLPAGALGDRYGRRGTLIIGTVLFGGAAFLGAFASTPSQLIGFRAVMGIGAALIMPGTLSTITSIFPAEERAKAVGIWAGFAGAGGTLGILMSGALLEFFSWGSVFIVTGAIAAVTLALVVAVVPPTKSTEHVRFDPAGAVLSAIGIGALVLGIIEGPERGWTDPVTLAALVGGVAFIVAFVWAELRSKAPMLDPRLFRHRGFATGSASLFLQFFAMFGFFFVSLQFLQLVLDYSTFTAALALTPMAVIMLPISARSGVMSERYGHKLVGGVGMAISAVGFLLFATLGPDSGFLPFLAASLIIGVGAPLAMTPATNAIVASLPREKQGVASAVNDTAREIGAAFGVAVLGSAFNIGYRGDVEDKLSGLPTDTAEQVKEAPAIALRIATDLDNTVLARATRDAFTIGMRYAMIVGAGLLLLGAAFVWLRGATRSEAQLDDVLDADLVIDDIAEEPATVPAA
jgi:EmrB/QacA subfamily drug resistance transporter